MKNFIGVSCAVAFLSLTAVTAFAADKASPVTAMTPDVVDHYETILPNADYIKRVVMIPMRDGVKLYTVIVMKKGTQHAPMLLSRTPYDAKDSTRAHEESAHRRCHAGDGRNFCRRSLHQRLSGYSRDCTIPKESG